MSYSRRTFGNQLPSLNSTTSSVNLSMAELPPLSPGSRLVAPSANPRPSTSLSMMGLPPLPVSPKASPRPVNGMLPLPKVSSGPINIPSLSPVSSSPVSSSTNLSMVGLPTLPVSPRASPRKLIKPEERVHLPSVSVPTHKVWPQLTPEEHLNEILSLPLYDIPTLEEVLAKTTQPFLREKLQRMIDEQRQYEGRGKPTRGWGASSPQRGRARHELMTQCGPSCFLDPANEKFPVCPKCQLGDGKCSCAIDCRGAQAAYNRAKQWGYESIAELADKLLKEKCGKTPSPKSPPKSPRTGRSPRNGRYFQY